MNTLEIRNLSKHYDGFSLENLSLTLPEGGAHERERRGL